MRKLDELTAERLLAVKSPEALFSGSIPEAKQEYRVLVRRWHPDCQKAPMATEVFSHVAGLYRLAVRKLRDGSWKEPAEKVEEETAGLKKFRCVDGSVRAVAYKTIRSFELGRMLIGDHSVAFEVEFDFADLFRQGLTRMQSLRFRGREMAVEISQSLPQIQEVFKTADSRVLVVRKTPDQLLLSDVLAHFNGKIEPIEHVGWILNVLYNLGCYLDWARIAHNAISPETFFVSPLRHSGMLLGGWWYATLFGQTLTALPDRSLKFIPPDIITCKCADSRSNLELIKSVGRELSGDAAGQRLLLDGSLPRAMVEWLQLPSSGDAVTDYSEWKYGVLEASFGAPSFVELQLASKDLYKED